MEIIFNKMYFYLNKWPIIVTSLMVIVTIILTIIWIMKELKNNMLTYRNDYKRGI